MARKPFSDPGGEVTGAPIGSPDWAKRVRLELQSVVDDLPKPIIRLEGYLRVIREHQAWKLMNRRDGSRFASFEELCAAERPWGLGIPHQDLARYLAVLPKTASAEPPDSPLTVDDRGREVEWASPDALTFSWEDIP